MNDTLTLIALMLGAGYASARLSWMPDNAAETLHRFVIYVCLPALVLTTVPRLTWRADIWLLVVTPWLLLGLGIAAVGVASRVLALSSEVRAVLLLCVPLGNTSFLGYPMLEALVGPDALKMGVPYDQLGSFLILATYGFFVVAKYGAGQVVPRWHEVLVRVVTFPSFIALCVGLLVPHAPWLWPETARALATRLGSTLVPVAMFAVGLKMQLRSPGPARALLFGLTTKLVAMPLFALMLARVWGAPELVAKVSVLQSGMPSMVSAGALAIMSGLAPRLAAALVGYGIVLSFLTLPLWAAIS